MISSTSVVSVATETELRDIIGTLLTFRRTAVDVAQVEPTPGRLVEIACIDSIIDAAAPLLEELPDEGGARQVALVRGVRALRRLLL